jgi:hypothetical protein
VGSVESRQEKLSRGFTEYGRNCDVRFGSNIFGDSIGRAACQTYSDELRFDYHMNICCRTEKYHRQLKSET